MDPSLLLHLAEQDLIKTVPRRDAWKGLSAYQSTEVVSRFLRLRRGHISDPNMPLDVSTHVTQGRQFFEAAAGSKELTKPLLLYYGVLSLCRALILFVDSESSSSSRSGHHGLQTLGWKRKLNEGLGSLPEVQVVVCNGTFNDLAKVTKNLERSFAYTDYRLRWPIAEEGTSAYKMQNGKTTFKLKDVLARIPDLGELYQITFDEIGACHPAYVHVYPHLQIDYYLLPTIHGLPDAAHIRHAFDFPQEFSVELLENYLWVGDVPGLHFKIHRENSPERLRNRELQVTNDSNLVPYIVEPMRNDVRLSSLSLLFLASFVMGTLVRYYPSSWALLTQHGPGDRLYPLLNAAIDLVEQRIPELVLQEIEQPNRDVRAYRHPSHS